jgi:hypothetical protein
MHLTTELISISSDSRTPGFYPGCIGQPLEMVVLDISRRPQPRRGTKEDASTDSQQSTFPQTNIMTRLLGPQPAGCRSYKRKEKSLESGRDTSQGGFNDMSILN